jgi:hypothetical protein
MLITREAGMVVVSKTPTVWEGIAIVIHASSIDMMVPVIDERLDAESVRHPYETVAFSPTSRCAAGCEDWGLKKANRSKINITPYTTIETINNRR